MRLADTVALFPEVVAEAADGETLARYEAVAAAVVCIRTRVERELSVTDPRTGLTAKLRSPVALHGTGIVIDTIRDQGRREYVILTNHHVADPSNYFVLDGRFLRERKDNSRTTPSAPESSFLVDSSTDEDEHDDILLLEIARNAAGDAALFKTVGAGNRELAVFSGPIGFAPGAVRVGSPVISSGFPNGAGRITARGEVRELERYHPLGVPHADMVVDVPLQPGQSGSPVFLIEIEEAGRGAVADVRFRLVITNTGEDAWVITDLTDAFDDEEIDLLSGKCSELQGVTLQPGESVTCTFSLDAYSPPAGSPKDNVAEVCVESVSPSGTTDCDDDDSRVTSAEVLGQTVTPTPTKTPPGGTAFTGAAAAIPLAGLALLFLTLGSGLLWIGGRRGRHVARR